MINISQEFEYYEHPEIDGIKRAWAVLIVCLIARRDKIIKAIKDELGGVRFPALYILVNSDTDGVYVGESADIYERIKAHHSKPPKELGEWDKGIIIWDGRPNITSIFSDTTMRQFLEKQIIESFKILSEFQPANKVEQPPELNYAQQMKATPLFHEIHFVLDKLRLIDARDILKLNQEKLEISDLEALLSKKGYAFSEWDSRLETVLINGKKTFFRAGSLKKKGWQITLKHTSKKFVDEGDEDGYFLISRGQGFLVPIKDIRDTFKEVSLGKETLDIFVTYKDDVPKIISHDKELDISNYTIS